MTGGSPASETTAVILLGASEWPYARQFESAAQFLNSATAFRAYALSPDGLGLPASNILDLFDSEFQQPVIVRRIAEYLTSLRASLRERGSELRDVITYYVGHGGFDTSGQSAYFMAVRATHSVDYLGSSLSAASLRRALRESAGPARQYLILDCCFAAAAVAPFIQMSAAAQSAVTQLKDNFPLSGTAILCAAGARTPARAPKSSSYTMFSEALIETLRNGLIGSSADRISFSELTGALQLYLREKYQDEAVRPELHCPEQGKGDISRIGVFPNAGAALTVAPDAGPNDKSIQALPDKDDVLQDFDEEKASPAIIYGHPVSHKAWEAMPSAARRFVRDHEARSLRFPVITITLPVIEIIGYIISLGSIYFDIDIFMSIDGAVYLKTLCDMVSFICILLLMAMAVRFKLGRTIKDIRVLRPLSARSSTWERDPALEPLRYPRIYVNIFGVVTYSLKNFKILMWSLLLGGAAPFVIIFTSIFR